ncbi:kazal-type serine protease inhibitor domain-containing protein 1-like [Ambystoma mexicanum]|uniref:kazal-type serine protease inhibitor domain-containing protein 1-like n=1 Tax=Ambystoma mexicanum TaxID=8296 RepID=UPI0037E73407
MKPLVVVVLLVVLLKDAQNLPTFHHRGWLRLLREGDSCGECELELCSKPTECPAGTVLDECECCPECGNVEGQICDLDTTSHFYGTCGHHLQCRLDVEDELGEVPEPQCICQSQESVCGSDGKTYANICKFSEIQATKERNLTMMHEGPCEAAPVISLPPRDAHNFTGNDIIFGCEVSAYPMPHLEWKKKGNHVFLPGDDAHISVQARGGPQKHGVTGWLQIQGIKKSDEGIYTCYTKNKYGTTYASAKLQVIDHSSSNVPQVITNNRITSYITDDKDYHDHAYGDEDDEDYESGDSES